MNSKVMPVLVVLLLLAAFLVGKFWTENQYLKSSSGTSNQVKATPTSTAQPEAVLNPQQAQTLASVGLVKGNPQAKVTIVEFSDFQCPYCSQAEPTLKQIFETYPDKVKLVYRHFPLSFHQNAMPAALASMCANEQGKFWEYHDKLFANQDKLTASDLKQYAADLGLETGTFNSCLETKKYKSQVDKDVSEATSLGVNGTPAFFINGRFLGGAYPFASFKAIIDEELAK